ncbi:MAG: ThiF family adenylyltransferase [Vicinamibacteria bacterium]
MNAAPPIARSARYSRQEIFAPIGREGQARLRSARIAIVGCGALGSQLAETMVRGGVGFVRLIDRDIVEESNLQRQTLFTEADAKALRPKALAAQSRLQTVNSEVVIEARVEDLTWDNARTLLDGIDLFLDGTDNFDTRYVLNDLSIETGIPWIYGACVGSYGLVLPVLRGARRTPCLRCVLGDPPPPGSSPTCDTAGVIAPIVQVIAGLQGAEALKILSGHSEAVNVSLVSIDVWTSQYDRIDLGKTEPSCEACVSGVFVTREQSAGEAFLCGRDAVQIRPPDKDMNLDIDDFAVTWRALGDVTLSEHVVRLREANSEMLLFRDGRALIKGTADLGRARAIYSRLIGS